MDTGGAAGAWCWWVVECCCYSWLPMLYTAQGSLQVCSSVAVPSNVLRRFIFPTLPLLLLLLLLLCLLRLHAP